MIVMMTSMIESINETQIYKKLLILKLLGAVNLQLLVVGDVWLESL